MGSREGPGGTGWMSPADLEEKRGERKPRAQIGALCRLLGCRVRQFWYLRPRMSDPRKVRLSHGPELWVIASGKSFLTAPLCAPLCPLLAWIRLSPLTLQTPHSHSSLRLPL